MTSLPRFVGAALGSVAIVVTIGVTFVTLLFWPHCDRDEKVLAAQSDGRSIVSCFEACTSFGTTVMQSIEFRSQAGERKALVEYEPSGGISGCDGKNFPRMQAPSVDWSNPNAIQISISVVYVITKRLNAINGIPVTYNIDTEISKDCSSSKS